MSNLTHWKSLTNTLYIGAYSLQPGEERVVQIVSVSRQPVKGTDGKETDCIVANLKNEKPFILNKTNCKTLTKVSGSGFIEDWAGLKITVYADKVKAFGDVVDALRIRPVKPMKPKLNPASPKWEGAIDALRKGSTTIDAIEKAYELTATDKKTLETALIPVA
jgi:hypothetical protein